jgi:acyl-CoA-binding protein
MLITFFMALQDEFQSAVNHTKQFTKRPGNEELLDLYALFKQATDGDVTGERPGGFDFKAIAKFDAWTARKGKSKEAAMQEYVDLVARLAKEYN